MSKSFYEFDGRIAALLGIQDHPGYLLPFSENQAEGAWANGSCVVKNGSDPGGDLTPDGIKGKILGSLKTPDGRYGYFVEWDNKPKMPIFCVEEKMKLLEKKS
jgi:hypothetical protein